MVSEVEPSKAGEGGIIGARFHYNFSTIFVVKRMGAEYMRG